MSKLEAFAKKNGVKYFLVNFTDLSGIQRSKLVPTPAIAGMEKNGAGFAGFATDMSVGTFYSDTPSGMRSLDTQVTITTYASLSKLAAMRTTTTDATGHRHTT